MDIITVLSLLLLTLNCSWNVSCDSPLKSEVQTSQKDTNPLINLVIQEGSQRNGSNSETPKVLSRVRRQYYDPYYYPYPVPVPIIVGGGFVGGFGYRGFGGRPGFGARGFGFGGRGFGFGARGFGFGGRGFGFGGRGFGGFGGRGRG